MENKVDAFKVIDTVLEWMAVSPYAKSPDIPAHEIAERMVKEGKMKEHSHLYSGLNSILEKLCKDGYLIVNSRSLPIEGVVDVTPSRYYYSITFDGRFFIQSGGYAGEYQRKMADVQRIKALEENQQSNTSKMTSLTVILAAGTIFQTFYYVYDITVNKTPQNAVSVLTILFVFIAGCVLGIVALLLAKEVISKNK